MGMSDYLSNRKDKLGKDTSKQELAQLFNDMSYDLIMQFIKQSKESNQPMDTTDLMRVYQIWERVNELDTEGSATGVMPSLSKTESDNLDDYVESAVEYDDEGNEVTYIDTDDLVNMSKEEIDKMVKGRAESLNSKNEDTA